MILNKFTTSKMLIDDTNEFLKKERQRSIDLVKQYNNKFIVIQERYKIVGQYDTAQEAYDKVVPQIGTFLIQQISYGECMFCNIKNGRIVKWGTTTIVFPQLEVLSEIPNQDAK